jgi:condensin complex subunit 1
MSILLPFLDAEPYLLRSSIVSAIANVLVHATFEQQDDSKSQGGGEGDEEEGPSSGIHSKESFTKTRESLLNILTERAHDVNSFTRAAVLKAWVVLCENRALPLLRVQGAALLAVDRLKDKTQIVRKAAMQVQFFFPTCEEWLIFFSCAPFSLFIYLFFTSKF